MNRDWVRDFNYVRGFNVHFHNMHAQITFRKSFAFTKSKIRLSRRIVIQNALLYRVSKAWFERALHSQRFRSGFQFQIRKRSESRSETAFGTWFVPLWTGPLFVGKMPCLGACIYHAPGSCKPTTLWLQVERTNQYTIVLPLYSYIHVVVPFEQLNRIVIKNVIIP